MAQLWLFKQLPTIATYFPNEISYEAVMDLSIRCARRYGAVC